MDRKVTAIIAAAGNGTRMGSAVKKQYLTINDKPILYYTLEKFYSIDEIDEIIVVSDTDNINFVDNEIIQNNKFQDKVKVVAGGKTRTLSVYEGLKAADKDTDIIIIHDGVRPFIDKENIIKCINTAINKKAVILCSKTIDTIKISDNNVVVKTLDRAVLWNAETPQCFEYNLIMDCIVKAVDTGIVFTDEASILEYYGVEVHIMENKKLNLKVTNKSDLEIANYLFNNRSLI